MKTGILSLTSGYNFGGTLQTVALSRSLAALGHEPVVIDYHPHRRRRVAWWRGWGLGQGVSLDRLMHRAWDLRKTPPHIRKYVAFKGEFLSFTRPCFDAAEVESVIGDLDAIVVGSDQVWNLQYHPDLVYYLSGMDSFKGKRISYAACCGNPAQGCPDWVPPALRGFHSVGVRNRFTDGWVRRCAGDDIGSVVVADPTLLIDDYPRLKLDLPERYIASYHIGLGDAAYHRRDVESLRRAHGDLPVVCLMPTAIALRKHPWHDHVLWNLDPFEWVEAVRRASAVYTDSYHAILFSLRNRVPLLATYAEEVRAPRLVELRDEHGLDGSIFRADSSDITLSIPDWDCIAGQFAEAREHSLRFLENSLRGT